MTAQAIAIQNLRFHHTSHWLRRKIETLHGVSVTVQRGEAFGFLGANGAGKTTTIKCLLGMLKPAAGSAQIFGIPSSDPHSRQQVGYLPELPYLYDYLTAHELVELAAALVGVPRSERQARVREALDAVGMVSRLKSPMRSLSKGLTQRVALAQAIVGKPQLLILDEPFSGLDPLGRREFRDLFRALNAAGTTLFMASHILSDVQLLCSRVAVMSTGRLKGCFALSELPTLTSRRFELTVHSTKESSLRLAGDAASIEEEGHLTRLIFEREESATRALETAVGSGMRVHGYQMVHGQLEDLFLQMVQDQGSQL